MSIVQIMAQGFKRKAFGKDFGRLGRLWLRLATIQEGGLFWLR
jgi:hypothetical protein